MKKCAVINDLSGFGKCSLTAALPILSVMGVEAHPMPTAVLSNQTAYESYKSVDLTSCLKPFAEEWKKLGVHFDAVLTGFVLNEEQLDFIDGFIDSFKQNDTLIVIDPVMADNGKLYDGYSTAMCGRIKELCRKADIITPNICELAFLAEEKPSESLDDIIRYGKKLLSVGIKSVVATGYKEGGSISNILFENGDAEIISAKRSGGYFSGTGDILSAVITGGVLRGMSLRDAVSLATRFIAKSAENTVASDGNDGVEFERFLGDIIIG